MEIAKSFLMLLGGLGVFLIGLKMMGDNLQNIAGNSLKTVFNRISNNRFKGVAVGAGVTAIIQSSSATTVMVVGFVNAGVMTLTQAASIIMGANIGTTITAQIVALQSLPITEIFAALACVGAFMMMFKNEKVNKSGAIIAGLGTIFIGLFIMGNSMELFKTNEAITSAFSKISNPLVLGLFGLAITALIQSSSATTSILITLCGAGFMNLRAALFVTLGINVGTCVTALLASIGATPNAKRASVIHLLFNCIGSVLFFIIVYFAPVDKLFEKMFPDAIRTQIAMFHTFFNVLTTVMLLPFINVLTKLSTLIIRDKKPTESEGYVEQRLTYIDDRMMGTPTIALSMMRKEILAMASLAKRNLDISIKAITTVDLRKQDSFDKRERQIDFMNKELAKYLVKISSHNISYLNEQEIASYYHVISDIERIGDYAENIMEYTKELIDNKSTFTEDAVNEINTMKDAVDSLYDIVMSAFINRDVTDGKEIEAYEDLVDTYKEELSKHHIARLANNICSVEAGGSFLSLVSNLERIADHIRNVFNSMKSYVFEPQKSKAAIKQ